MRKKVGAKKVGGERERREEQEKVLGAWRVAAAKGQVPREDEGGADPTQRAIKAVGKKALETRRCPVWLRCWHCTRLADVTGIIRCQ